ncbi:MAG: lysine--tRNA ligase [Kiritimatiellae bacterium]|jgi:lysyl-tRNA synthetase class 2|nr:lysine--tRNA ligase [Kiritimatiellia bacterium]
MTDNNEYRQQRLENLEKLREMGYKPFGKAFKRDGNLKEIREGFAEEKKVKVAARLLTIRKMGKSIFADLSDGEGRFQLYVGKNQIGEEAFAAFKLLDLGDQIGVDGELFTTRMGEPTIKVASWELLSKSLLPLPEKWHGLQDVEARYRQRYLDLISNSEVRDVFNKRIKIISEIRSYLSGRGFYEVETPMIQSEAGGAAAKPFQTRYNALGEDMFLRIAPELYLKRLLVGGFDKVYELNRNFRNEGLDRTHNPEFTMLEIYEAYSDVEGMKDIIQGMIIHVAEKVFGTLQVGEGENAIDFSLPWREATYHDLVKEKMGDDWFDLSLDEAKAKVDAAGLAIEPAWDMLMVTHEVYEKLIEHTLIQPTFVRRLPKQLIPLAKETEDNSDLVDVFELVIRGQEVAPAYTELNDPLVQRQRLEEQAGEDLTKIDDDFLTAMEHGMPPAGGMGVGIDRLIMILLGADAIRDVILFPQLRSLKSKNECVEEV